MNEREECEAYLKDLFITGKIPEGEESMLPPPEERERLWNEMKKNHKDFMIDMVLGFKGGGTAFQEIKKEFDKKAHSDLSFGMIVKNILAKK